MRTIMITAISLILLSSLSLMAQEQTLKYNIRVLGMDVGVLTVKERIDGRDTIVEALTDVKVRIVFTYKVKYIQKSTHRGGELLCSSLETYKKDKLNSSTQLTRMGSGYRLETDEETAYIDNKIPYSGSLLYFHEPEGIAHLYYEISGEKKPIRSIGGHAYSVVDPENGRESIFEYEGGVLQRSSIEHGIATIYTERLMD